jgi:hypothetical protein
MCYTWAPPGAKKNNMHPKGGYYANNAENQGQQPLPFDPTTASPTQEPSIFNPLQLSNTSQPAFCSPHQVRLSEIHALIQQSLSSRPPTSEASRILIPSFLHLYTAAGSILQSGLTSSPVVALNRYALAEAVEACLPSSSDFTNPDPSPKPRGNGSVDESAILEAKKRFIECLFRETDSLGTTEMIEFADYVQRIGGQCAGNLVSEEEDEDEDGDENDTDYVPDIATSWNMCIIEHGDTLEVAIRKLVAYTENATALVNSSRNLSKGQFVAVIESMRNETLQQLSTPDPDLDKALNILLLVKHLGVWTSISSNVNIDGLAMDFSKSEPHELKLIELLYGAAKSLSNAEMQDFLARAGYLMSAIQVDLGMVAPQD